MSQSYIIQETEQYYPLSVLFHDSGMEIEVSDTPPSGMVKMWRMDDAESGELISAATLQIRDGVYTLGDIAVREDHRSEGLGKRMQKVVFDEARSMGVKELWGSAKVPDYYYRLGWKKMDWDSSPKVGVNCHTCTRRGKSCFPAIIKMDL
ncbi:MAG: GNAT family N-acetyltransferase [Oscillospiraceae bacterium]|nr:GNAT family N-acetyltransferase [Oscillospiraceae bacterium]